MSIELEDSLMGTLLFSTEYRNLIFDLSDADYFNYNRTLYLECCRQHSEGVSFNEATISSKLDLYTQDRLLELQMNALVSESQIKDYLHILKEDRDKKVLRRSVSEVFQKSMSEDVTADDLILMIDKLSQQTDDASDVVALTPTEIFVREKENPIKEKLLTNINTIDNILYENVGMHKGDINVVLADSGHGKTQFCNFISVKLLEAGYKGLWFQMEDYDVNTASQLAANTLEYCDNMLIVDSVDDIDEIKRCCRKIKQENGLDFVVIDYIQEVYAKGRFNSRTLELNYVTKILKQIAKELNVLLLVPSQVTINDHVRHGWQLEPRYKDAQWAQVIKNVAHCMTSIFRPSMIPSLVSFDGVSKKVKGWRDMDTYTYNSVFAKIVKSRRGIISHQRIHLEHITDKGLEVAKKPF